MTTRKKQQNGGDSSGRGKRPASPSGVEDSSGKGKSVASISVDSPSGVEDSSGKGKSVASISVVEGVELEGSGKSSGSEMEVIQFKTANLAGDLDEQAAASYLMSEMIDKEESSASLSDANTDSVASSPRKKLKSLPSTRDGDVELVEEKVKVHAVEEYWEAIGSYVKVVVVGLDEEEAKTVCDVGCWTLTCVDVYVFMY